MPLKLKREFYRVERSAVEYIAAANNPKSKIEQKERACCASWCNIKKMMLECVIQYVEEVLAGNRQAYPNMVRA